MVNLKVCFVGVGSIAKRHIKNLSELCLERHINLTIDALRKENNVLEKEVIKMISNIYLSVDNLPRDYDVIFLTNPTEYHLSALKELQSYAKHFFIEKPLTTINKANEIEEITLKEDAVYYVACPLRYTSVIGYLKNSNLIKETIAVICICSSYLPDWRPNTDYRKNYASKAKMGEGVSVDLIHEWDYLKYLFGKPDTIVFTYGKKSDLELQCEDYANYIAEYKDKVIELHLDYFGRVPIREMMLFTKTDTVIVDLIHSNVRYLKSGKVIDFAEKRNDYQKRELLQFLDIIEKKKPCENTIQDAYDTLKLTQGEV